jgi:outer membrane receptor protein involved in Fe transport
MLNNPVTLVRTFLTALLIIFPSFVFSQAKAVLNGSVRDAESGMMLTGATVVDAGNKMLGVSADLDGRFKLEVPPGRHRFICSFLGYSSDTIDLKMEPGGVYTRDIKLKPVAIGMGPVVVSASKYEQRLDEVTVSMQILQPKLIESKNTVNIKSALEQSPGLTILDEEPQMRGGSGFSFGVGSRVATMIDGLPILTGDAGRTDWAFIPTENIEQVEIIEGASSVLYGSSALSGTINFRTRYPKDKSSTYIRTYSGFYSAPKRKEAKWWDGNANFTGLNFSHGMKFQQHDLMVGGAFNYDHNFIGPYILDGSFPIKADTLDNSDVANRTGRFNFNYRFRSAKIEGLSAGLNGNVMTGKTNFSLVWGNDSSGLYRAFPGTMTLTEFTAFYLDPFVNYQTAGGFRHTLKGRWYRTDNDNSNDQSNQTNIYLANYEFGKTFTGIGDLNVTGGLFLNETRSVANLYAGSGRPDNNLKNRAGYLQLSKKFFNVINLVAGMRGEYFELNGGEDVFEPVFRTGLNIEVTKGTNLRASYGQGYRYPTIAEKFIITSTGGIYVFPNPKIRPESSWSAEAGVKQGFKFGKFMAFVDLALFQQEYQNTIEYIYAIWATDSAGFKFVNTGNTRVKGYEVSLMGSGKIGTDVEVNFLMGYTYVMPQTLNPSSVFAIDSAEASGGVSAQLAYNNTSTDTTDNILKYRFRHLVKADVELTYRNFSIGASARYYSFMENIDKTFYDLDKIPGTNIDGVLPTGIIEYREKNNDGSLVFDARISYRFAEKFTVALISNNIANLEYTLRPLKIESPRTIALQLSAKL